jgi:hypothetical protein
LTLGSDVSAVSLTAAVNASDTVDFAARELRVRLPYDRSAAEWRLRTTCAGEQTVHTVTVEVEPLPWTRGAQWQPGVNGPTAREYFSWWMDELAPERLLLFGGFVYQPMQFTPNAELWELAVPEGTWTQLHPAGTPPALTGGRLARDPGTRSALYLGGFTSNFQTPYALHRIEYTAGAEAWVDLTAQTAGGRGDYQPGLLHDPVRERFLSFCGANTATGHHCEVRQLVNGAWSPVPVAPGAAPQGRNGHAFGYDARNDRAVLFGGDRQGMTFGDTWTLELAEDPPRWVQLFESSPVAPARRNAAFAIDPVNHRLFVWGGTTTGATAIPGLVALDLVRGTSSGTRSRPSATRRPGPAGTRSSTRRAGRC